MGILSVTLPLGFGIRWIGPTIEGAIRIAQTILVAGKMVIPTRKYGVAKTGIADKPRCRVAVLRNKIIVHRDVLDLIRLPGGARTALGGGSPDAVHAESDRIAVNLHVA